MQIDKTATFGAGRLGFGCALLHGAVSAREGAALLEFALDNGIALFDTARVYGWGATEAMLGEVARRRRDEMVIISKAGMVPPSLAGRAIKKIAGRFSPRLADLGDARLGCFAPEQLTQSVERSLSALKTDRLDALLLHEIELEHVADAMKQTLQALKQSGKVLRIGISTSLAATAAIEAAHPDLCEVVQVAALPVGAPPRPATAQVRIINSVLRDRLSAFAEALAADPARAKRFAEETGIDPADRAALARLLLQAAMHEGVALFSSTRRDNIASNATLLAANDSEALKGFARFLAAA